MFLWRAFIVMEVQVLDVLPCTIEIYQWSDLKWLNHPKLIPFKNPNIPYSCTEPSLFEKHCKYCIWRNDVHCIYEWNTTCNHNEYSTSKRSPFCYPLPTQMVFDWIQWSTKANEEKIFLNCFRQEVLKIKYIFYIFCAGIHHIDSSMVAMQICAMHSISPNDQLS